MNNDMPRRALWPAPLLIALLALPLATSAQQAYTRYGINLRAGPSNNYPVVARLGGGQPLDVVGCTRGYGWCDVALPDGLRGWLYAPGLDYVNDGNRVPLAGYGAAIGIPIVGFAVGSYWGNYYRDRPWYGERRWWGNAAPPPVYGWARPAYARPAWQPRPFVGPGPGFVPGPGYRAGYAPGYAPGYRHGHAPGYAPGYRHGYAPGYAPRHAPGYAPGFAPRQVPPAGPGYARNVAVPRGHVPGHGGGNFNRHGHPGRP